MSVKTTLLPIAIVLLLIMSACKPKVEGETKSWAENQKKAAEYKAKYPAFATALDESFAEASKIWDEAAKITKEEDKALKMREANDSYEKLVGGISKFESNVEDANSTQTKAYKKKYPSSVMRQVNSDMDEASTQLSEAVNKFHDAQPATLDEAITIAKECSDGAADARSKYDGVVRKALKK